METIVRELPLTVFVTMIVFLCGMAGIALYAGLHARRRAALLERVPTSLVALAEDGYREFEGVVEAIGGQVLTSPLTRSPCCWYRVRIERWGRAGGDDRSDWSVVRDETSSAPFFIRDASGVCTVQAYDAEITPTDRSVWTGANETPDDLRRP